MRFMENTGRYTLQLVTLSAYDMTQLQTDVNYKVADGYARVGNPTIMIVPTPSGEVSIYSQTVAKVLES